MSISAQLNKKSRKRCHPNGEDIISNLPESVICHILSRLPSKDAVRTSVLSKGWERKWTTSYNIHIIDWEQFSNERRKKSRFINFMDKILLLPHDLKSFRLLYSPNRKYTDDLLMNWISAALGRKIESFELQPRGHKCIALPITLLSNNTCLRTMKLKCILKVPRDVYFPHLTSLHLDHVEILNKQSNVNQLVFTFPALKTFVLTACKWANVKMVDINSPALRTFKCERPFKWENKGYPEISDHLIKICGARLEKFESLGQFPENIMLRDSTVHKAALQGCPVNYYLTYGTHTRKLMEGFSNLAILELSSSMCEAIEHSKKKLPLPVFDRLLQLVMCIGSNADLLLELLHSAPSLKFLKLDKGRKKCDFAKVDSVPYCVTSHLTEVVFCNIRGKPLIDLANFFLINGLGLQKVYVEGRSQTTTVVKRLKEFPKASPCVEIFPPGSFSHQSVR